LVKLLTSGTSGAGSGTGADAETEAESRRALVFGGTGYIGAAVVRALSARGIGGAFTYLRSAERAGALASETGFRAMAVDMRDAEAIRRAVRDVDPDVFVHAATLADPSRLADINDSLWDDVMSVNVRSAFIACRELFATMRSGGGIVLCAGPDAIPSAPSAPHFAASQAALAGFVRAAAHDLGPRGVRINVVAFGIMDGGASSRLTPEELAEAAKNSALRRLGTAAEAARAVLWVALHGAYMNGAVVAVAGGL
jgi:3-oxoacyl-[acyl-carrier protein] reductase